MRQRRKRRRRRIRGLWMRPMKRRGRLRDEVPTLHQTTNLCRYTDNLMRAGNEPGLVDCLPGDCRCGRQCSHCEQVDMNCGLNDRAARSTDDQRVASGALMKMTTKQSRARELSADLTHRARHAHTNLVRLILLALTVTLSCCYFDPNPSSATSSTWQVLGQILEPQAKPNETIVFKTSQGQLFRGSRWPGEESGDVAEFLGIRYASAPVKRLRFMPPTAFTYAKGPLHDFTQPGPICMQRMPLEVTRAQRNLIGQYLGNSATNETIDYRLELMQKSLLGGASEIDRLVRNKLARFVQSEDCLNLNIYTPIEALNHRQVESNGSAQLPHQQEDARESKQSDAGDRRAIHNNGPSEQGQLPVLVLVHGQSFDFGSGSLLEARKFARDNRLIVITLNYRLNILGFPPKFGSASRANLGLLDQVAALHWIRANIRSFGGAPENITLMGYKRGAIFVHLLMLSPLAKDLFRRAILEDGTALSPVVANNLLATNSQQQQQQVALLHLRALAHLCGCPLSSSAGNSTETLGSGLAQATNGLGEHEQRGTINSLMFECLRTKPSELLVQHIPSDLVDLSRLAQTTPVDAGHLPIATKWRAPLERLFELLSKEELKRRLEVAVAATANGSDESTGGGEGVNQQLDEFKRLFESSPNSGGGPGSQLAIKPDQLNRLAALLVVKLAEHRNERRLSELIIDVLSALYLPSNETLPIGPVFAPQLESGTLVGATPSHDQQLPESDQLANAMLQRDSPFGQRDLMIGLTAPLVDFSAHQGQHQDGFLSYQSEASHRELPLERHRAGRLLELGLTEAQAIGQVNLFVRSLYRFHQQEISNSIVNQYLNSKKNIEAAFGLAANGMMESNEVEQARVMSRRKQMFLLKSLQELYEDALVHVPMLKTVLIHSLRQLDLLADLFVTQQLDRMQTIMDEAGGHGADSLWDGPSAVALNQLLEPRLLQDRFYTFVRGLYRASSIWPIRLQSPPVNTSGSTDSLLETKRPRSTFLYQFASSPSALKTKLSHRLQFVLTQLERHPIARSRQSLAVQELKAVLMKLIEEINSSQVVAGEGEFEFNFSCTFSDSIESEPVASLLRKLNFWICREQIGKTLASFVRTGNTNEATRPSADKEGETPTNQDIEARLERYQSECMANHFERDSNQDHLVQLASESITDKSNSNTSANYEILVEQPQERRDGQKTSFCRNRIQSLAYEFLFKFRFLQEAPRPSQGWPVFNVFGQQLANFNLVVASDQSNRDSGEFSLESFVSSPSSQREQFDSKVAFWANFIPALNCSRTQPIGAQSLSLFSQANSTLLNMNLNFNCQQQQQQQQQQQHQSNTGQAATKTANSQLQSMLARIRNELTEVMRARQRLLLGARNQLASSAAATGTNSSGNQNHHSPRMANMSTSQQQAASQLDEMVADSTHLTNANNSNSNSNNNNNQNGYSPQNWLSSAVGSSGSSSSPVNLARRAFAFISRQSASVAFWLLSAVFLLVILVVLVSGLAVARQWKLVRARLVNRRRRRKEQRRQQQQQQAGGQNEHSPASLQLDASFLQEINQHQASRQQLMQQTSYERQDANETGNFCQQQRSSSTSFMATPPQVAHQTHDLVERPEDQILLPPPSLTNRVSEQSPGGDYQHLPTCNLMTMNNDNHQMQQTGGGGGLLTSSTSSETTNGRAQSSVSLVSTSGTLTGTNGNSAGAAARGSLASVATIKKRVKISDPKRRPRSPSSHAAAHDDFGGHATSATPHSLYADSAALYCPIHRASSTNLNFIASEPSHQHQNHSNHFDAGQMTRSASSYYGQAQQQQQQAQFDQYGVCPAHENYDQQQQQLMLMSQLYLASANKTTNSLHRSPSTTSQIKMNKSISSIVCLLVLVAACNSSVEARPKRSIYYAAAPVVAAPAVTVPVVQHSHVVHSNPTSVVKTEQVRSGDHASYSYTSEIKTQPIVHTHTHAVAAAAAPVVAAAPVATAAVAHAYYPYAHAYYPSAYPYSYYSPYSYVVGK